MYAGLNIERMRLLMASLYKDRGMDDIVFKLSKNIDQLIVNKLKTQVEYKKKSTLETKYIEIVHRLLKAVERKNCDLEGHLLRVFLITLDLTLEMNLSQQEIMTITNSAILHDVGKFFIDNSILDKPGRLNNSERIIMNKHPEIGANFISKLIDSIEIFEIIKYHHERPDGRGYPEQLSDKEIPLGAKIIAVADAFDAMTSSRPYRLIPKSKSQAVNIIIENNGTQFDKEIVEIFLRLYEKNKELAK